MYEIYSLKYRSLCLKQSAIVTSLASASIKYPGNFKIISYLQMLKPYLILPTALTVFIQIGQIWAWPDGAPCVYAAFESMNPLEAVEHQGGLMVNKI